ncbi:hypothetical protein [Fodinicurvata sediminis]|uniref:hypothetical protein n=1 Tax=Fodinicurvata sediminis TaxID=1121832 RepID=UPI0003FFFB9C|nr:hypothetical protein [Fodinicurvata sediminis]
MTAATMTNRRSQGPRDLGFALKHIPNVADGHRRATRALEGTKRSYLEYRPDEYQRRFGGVANDIHMALALMESADAGISAATAWLDEVEFLLGHSLDGDERQDGYSLDYGLDLYRAGLTAHEAAELTAARKRRQLAGGAA